MPATATSLTNSSTRGTSRGGPTAEETWPATVEVGLLTGCRDKPYAFGLATMLLSKGVSLDFIGSDETDSPELHENPNLRFLNLRGNQRSDAGVVEKIRRILVYYARLIRYASMARPQIFHILWNNKFEVLDRTLLMLYYKLRGKKIAFTAHNVNIRRRDSNDSLLNRLTLAIQYRLADHIFVHTEAMKRELVADFYVRGKAITVIPLGYNNSVPDTDLTATVARRRLNIEEADRTILFFGYIAPYKGLDLLVAAFRRIAPTNPAYRLVVAGTPKEGGEKYLENIQQEIRDIGLERVIERIEFIHDDETELYFKAADVLVLPYRQVFQSGVLVLAHTFGLPVIATDVGSLREDIVEGQTGFLCRPDDPVDLARTIEMYFESNLFRTLPRRRQEIRDYARERFSWETVADRTLRVYRELHNGLATGCATTD